MGFSDSSVGKESPRNAGDPSSIPESGRSAGEGIGCPRREWLTTKVCWPREFHGLYSPWGHKELDTTERISHLYYSWLILAAWVKYFYWNRLFYKAYHIS